MSLSELNETDKKILSTIRKNPYCKKSKIADLSDISWTTAVNAIDRLMSFKMISITSGDSALEKNLLHVNNSFGYFIGVSVGSSHIKVCVLDFAFSTVKYSDFLGFFDDNSVFKNTFWVKNHLKQSDSELALWCTNTYIANNNTLAHIKSIVDGIGRMALELSEGTNKVLLIGFSFPGHIDNKNNVIIKSSNLDLNLNNVSPNTLFTSELLYKIQEKGISIYFEHNVKAAAVAEKVIGRIQDINHNCAVLYLGAGLGVTFLLNGMLYRGDTNAAGQIGHVKVERKTHYKCTCGSESCLEQYLREIFEVPTEELDPNDKIYVKDSSGNQLADWLNKKDHILKREEFVKCISRVLFNLSDLLEINTFVFTGKLGELYTDLESLFQEQMILNNKATINIVSSESGEYSASKGTAICGYYHLIDYSLL